MCRASALCANVCGRFGPWCEVWPPSRLSIEHSTREIMSGLGILQILRAPGHRDQLLEMTQEPAH